MAKVHHQVVIPNITPCCSPDNEPESSPLSTSYMYNEVGVLVASELTTFVDNVTIPTAIILEGIWKKAAELHVLCDTHKLVLAPRKTTKRPHLVTPGEDGRFACDSDCPNFKCFGICSHVVTVAQVNHNLPPLTNWFEKEKKVLSLSPLVKAGMPKGQVNEECCP